MYENAKAGIPFIVSLSPQSFPFIVVLLLVERVILSPLSPFLSQFGSFSHLSWVSVLPLVCFSFFTTPLQLTLLGFSLK